LYEFYTKNTILGKIDIIQTHFGNNIFYGVRLRKKLKAPLFAFFYGMDVSVLTKRYPKIYKYCKEYVEKAFTTSKFLRDKLREREIGIPIQVNRLGINISEWPHRSYTAPERKEKIKIVNVGRLVEFKGHEYLIAAHKLLKNRGYKVETIIIGDGPRRKLLEYLILKLGLLNEVKLTGAISNEEVKTHLCSANFFVFPSVVCKNGKTEELGYACIEAMATGLPVVASSVGGIPEYIINNETGLLVEQRNPRQIAEAIEELINNPRKARQLSNRARQLVESEFDIKENMKKIELEYSKHI
jgi:colanic acid/amylovoran biosynthesis glycosyltransferase